MKYKCDECEKTFDTENECRQHEIVEHKNANEMQMLKNELEEFMIAVNEMKNTLTEMNGILKKENSSLKLELEMLKSEKSHTGFPSFPSFKPGDTFPQKCPPAWFCGTNITCGSEFD